MTLPRRPALALLIAALSSMACAPGDREPEATSAEVARTALLADLQAAIEDSPAETVGLYYRSLGEPDSVALDADVRMHAASTMKVPVMMRLYADQDAGLLSMDDSMVVTTTFHSIVDGTPYELAAASDSDTALYHMEGQAVGYRELVERMITRSSNLATNLLIAEAEPARIAELMADIGADSMDVLRGVEDLEAFEAGLSNTTTARSLGAVMRAVARGEGFGEAAADSMLAILERQEFTENIPAGLPEGTRVANKTGWITGIHHDAAVVFPHRHPGSAPPYVLVIMVRGHPGDDQGTELMQRLSRRVWSYHTR